MRRSIYMFALLSTLVLIPIACGSNPAAPTSKASPTPVPLSVAVSFGSGTMNNPEGIVVSGSDLWVVNASGGNTNLQEWPTNGGSPVTTITSYGSPATLLISGAVNIGSDGYIYSGDSTHYKIVEFSPTLTYVSVFGSAQLQASGCHNFAEAVSPYVAYVLDEDNSDILAYTIAGSGSSKTFVTPVTFGNSGSGALSNPRGICLDTSNNVYAADYSNKRIVEYNSSGVYQAAITLTSLGVPYGVAVDTAGNIYALDTQNHDVQMFTSSGSPVTQFGASALSSGPYGIAVDAAKNIWVSDANNNQVVKFNHY